MRVDTIDERLALFGAMAEHAGLDLDTLAVTRSEEVRAAAQRCLGCRDAPECHRWFETRDDISPVPGFCRNVEQFSLWEAEETAAMLKIATAE